MDDSCSLSDTPQITHQDGPALNPSSLSNTWPSDWSVVFVFICSCIIIIIIVSTTMQEWAESLEMHLKHSRLCPDLAVNRKQTLELCEPKWQREISEVGVCNPDCPQKERHISSPRLPSHLVSTPRSLLLLLPLLSCHAHSRPLLSPSVGLLLSSPIFHPAFSSLCSPHLCCVISCFPTRQNRLLFFCVCSFCPSSWGKPDGLAPQSPRFFT